MAVLFVPAALCLRHASLAPDDPLIDYVLLPHLLLTSVSPPFPGPSLPSYASSGPFGLFSFLLALYPTPF